MGPSHSSPEQRHSNNDTTHPSIRPLDMVKTTNPKHTPPTRNHPADKQTPPQYKAKKPDATAKRSDARPAGTTHDGQSRTAQDHHSTTTARNTEEDRTQQRAPKAKSMHKAHTGQMRPHQPPKNTPQ
ncbi:hypothetical protein AMECASPLE_034228 [Ameca splendens]|uniref:Uncharacterized protein n=1 Tax=Ameca splendens TaxID=208324 RepID=A0ABV0Y7D1_9TELE